jgi:hypothetical protein
VQDSRSQLGRFLLDAQPLTTYTCPPTRKRVCDRGASARRAVQLHPQAYNKNASARETVLTIEEQVVEKLCELPTEKQKEVLDFVDFLKQRNSRKKPLAGLRGLWRDLNIDVTEEGIAEARREMWGDFPGDIS